MKLIISGVISWQQVSIFSLDRQNKHKEASFSVRVKGILNFNQQRNSDVARKIFWASLSVYRVLLIVQTKNYVVSFLREQVPPLQ